MDVSCAKEGIEQRDAVELLMLVLCRSGSELPPDSRGMGSTFGVSAYASCGCCSTGRNRLQYDVEYLTPECR